MVKPSERLGNYELATSADGSAVILGVGSGGVTYRGKHIHLGTEVAIKVLIRRKNLLQKDRDAFLSEARAAASLSHPQIVRILDFGENSQQHPYYVMELCEGGSLEELGRKSGPPDDYTCIQWLFESTSALAHAHQKGIFHRDIKPSNLLVATENGTASIKLIDFGLADHADLAEVSDAVIGTPLFAAPEQLRGKAEAASDVFSLGATFLWLLTGKHLSRGDVKSVISERLDAVSYASIYTSLPAPWKSILGRMLEVNPSRRLRDGGEVLAAIQATFPNHACHPVTWNPSDNSQGAGPGASCFSQWIDHPATEWSALWVPVSTPVSNEYGISVRAQRPGTNTIHDVLYFNTPPPGIIPILTDQGDLIARFAVQLGLDHVLLERGDHWWSAAWPSCGNDDALSWVRQGETASTTEILAALDPIAIALDGMKSSGLDHLEIHPSMLTVSGGGADGTPLSFSLAVQLPILASDEQEADAAGTMRGAMGAGLCARFASCVYQLLSGRTVASAAFVNTRAYQAIPRLMERSNRFLSSAIAGTLTEATCRDVISGLAYEERIPGASYSDGGPLTGGASFGAHPTSQWRSNPSLSTAIPIASGSHRTAAASHSAPLLLADSPVATEQPTAAQPPISHANRWIVVSTIAAAFLLLGISAWVIISKWLHRDQRNIAPQEPAMTTGKNTTTMGGKESSKSNDDSIPSLKSKSLIKIPGDVTSIGEAVKLCQEGGVIEITGGTYTEAIVLTKSVSLVSTPAAVFEDSGLGSNLVVVRGEIQVTLRNIQFKNTEKEAKSSARSSPALILITDGASTRFDGCVIEGALGNGVSLADNATALFSNCRIRKNRGYGINVSSISKVEISLSEVQGNGLSGIALMNVGSIVTLSSGTTVGENSGNGVEVANGAVLQCSGATINNNQSVGLIVDGSGSQARLESSCLISGNRKYGVGVLNAARAFLSDSMVEDNSENGLYAESGAQVDIRSCQFKSNGTMGVYLVNGASSEVTIAKTLFQSHSDSGAVFVEGIGKVTECRFINNNVAVYFGKGARGAAIGNTIRPGPIENVLIMEDSGDVSVQDNIISADR